MAKQGAVNARTNRQANELVNDLTSLLNDPPRPTLRREESRGAIPAARGYAEKNQQLSSRGEATGIASPLTEGSAIASTPQLARTYYDLQTITSSDGLFVWEVETIKAIHMYDANGAEVVFNFAEPRHPPP